MHSLKLNGRDAAGHPVLRKVTLDTIISKRKQTVIVGLICEP